MKKITKQYEALSKEARASLWFIACNIVQKGITFFTVPVFTRLLTTTEYGVSNIYQSWMSIIVIFATLNIQYGAFDTAMIRFEKDRERFISSMQGLSTCLTIGILVIYCVGFKMWNQMTELSTVLMLTMFGEMLLSPALGFWSGKQRFEVRYKVLVGVTLAIALLNPVIGILAVIGADDRGTARVVACAAVNMIAGLILYIFNWKKGRNFFVKEYWKYALGFCVPLIPYYLSQMIFNQSDRIMISHLCGKDKAGIYGVAYSLGLVLTFVINAINSAYVPWVYKNIKAESYKKIKSISNGIVILIAGMLLLLILFTPEIMRFIAAPEYYEAIWVVPPITASLLLLFLTQLSINVEFYFGENKLLVKGSILSAIINVILNYILIPIFGYAVAGYTTLISYIIFCITNYYCMKKVCKKHIGEGIKIYNFKFLFTFMGVFIAVAVGFTILYNFTIIRYVVAMMILMIVFWKRNIIIEKMKEIRS